jgi:uncharacterized protein YqgC (DUF456 family)
VILPKFDVLPKSSTPGVGGTPKLCALAGKIRQDASMAWVLAIVLVVVGLVGVVMPALPGTVLIFAGLLLAAWTDGFVRVGVVTMVILGVLTVASYFVDVATMALGMKRLGTTRRAMAGAALGTLAGLFFGLPGIIIGPFAGAMLGELTADSNWRGAGKAGLAAWIGFLIGTMVKVGLAFAMVGIFLTAWFI